MAMFGEKDSAEATPNASREVEVQLLGRVNDAGYDEAYLKFGNGDEVVLGTCSEQNADFIAKSEASTEQ